jgi:hypothetical protein
LVHVFPPGGFKKPREAYIRHFHLGYLSNLVLGFQHTFHILHPALPFGLPCTAFGCKFNPACLQVHAYPAMPRAHIISPAAFFSIPSHDRGPPFGHAASYNRPSGTSSVPFHSHSLSIPAIHLRTRIQQLSLRARMITHSAFILHSAFQRLLSRILPFLPALFKLAFLCHRLLWTTGLLVGCVVFS